MGYNAGMMLDRRDRELFHELLELGVKTLKKYLAEGSATRLTLSIEGIKMTSSNPDYQLTLGDNVVVTITATDDVTGAAVTPDPGSVTASLSNPADSVVVDPSGTFLTINAGSTPLTGNTVTVNATVNGIASAPAVGVYDDVAAAVPPDATSLSLSFGTESAPVAAAAATPRVFNETTGNFEDAPAT